MGKLHDFEVTRIDGTQTTLADYAGKVVVIVNVASKCGLTPQYAGLEALYQTYRERGLEILGFPCNQFGAQEPGTESEIVSFCALNYSVSFPMFSKIDVNGSDSHPLYVHLKSEAPGLLGTELIKWNFTKFLVDRAGNVTERFGPKDEPSQLAAPIEKLL
ncbi:MAG: glutathione peroxidase [Myxococcales bacterium]|nr:glutathione peroxidase [Myxococcales bacterium]